MNSHKILFSTLFAAAAMSVPAMAFSFTSAGTISISTTDSIELSADAYYTVGNSTETLWANAATIKVSSYVLNIVQSANGAATKTFYSGTTISGTGSVWLWSANANSGYRTIWDLTGVTASGFSGILGFGQVANGAINANQLGGAELKIAGDTWSNVEVRLVKNNNSNPSILALSGATSVAGLSDSDAQLESSGFTESGSSRTQAGQISVATSGTVLTLAGTGTYSFSGTVGSSSATVGISKTGSGMQAFGGTNYFDAVNVSAGTLNLSSSTTSFGGAVTVSENATLNLSNASVSLSSAIENSGTVTVDSGANIAISGIQGTTTNFDENTTGLQTVGISYTFITGTGTVSGISTNNLTINGSAATSISDDGKTATISGQIYNIASGATKTISEVEGTDGWVSGTAINVLGTLETGSSVSSLTSSVISGSGKVAVTVNSSDGEQTISTANLLTGSISVVKSGTGKLTVNVAQNYTGGTEIAGGNVGIQDASALGSGTITLTNGQLTSQTGGMTLANAISVTAGTIYTSNGITLSGKISGSGTLTKEAGGSLYITGTTNEFSGTLVVSAGTVYIGQSGNSRTENANLSSSSSAAKIQVASGASFITHMGSNNSSSLSAFYGDFYLASGSTLGNKDGHVKLAGNIVFGATDLNGNYATDATVSYTQYWQKTVEFAGTLSGAGTVTFYNATAENGTAYYKFSGSNNSFSGTYKLAYSTTDKSTTLQFQLLTETAAASAKIDIQTEHASLKLGNSAVKIAGLNGVQGSSVGLLSGTSASTLTIAQSSDTTFAGTIADAITLVKSESGTLTLSGANTYTGGTTISAGTLIAANANALGTGNLTVAADATLGLIAGTTVSLGDSATVTLTEGANIVVDFDGYSFAATQSAGDSATSITLNLITAASFGTNLSSVNLSFKNLSSDYDNWTKSLGTSSDSKTLTLTMTIPEPSMFGLLAGLGALALAGTRRRRRK